MLNSSFFPSRLLFIAILWTMFACGTAEKEAVEQVGWPKITRDMKPWTRWWWQGSALTEAGITAALEAYKQAGLGGVEITPIYGVYGDEDQFVDYLSERWMQLLTHTLQEAERLDLGVDMATGTGWPFGGPWVHEDDACRQINYVRYTLKGGEHLGEKITFIQPPMVRLVGSQLYQTDESFGHDKQGGTARKPAAHAPAVMSKPGAQPKVIEPIEANPNLQALAPDQVKFEKSLPIYSVTAYSAQGEMIDLTEKVDSTGVLNWVAPAGNWEIYALFQGWHGKMVERAAPGGEGNVIDHFSTEALNHYLDHFHEAFQPYDISTLRAFFNDSYEVDDARGCADWTPLLFYEFKKQQGYDLREQLPALFGHADADTHQRVLCDYRETISEMIRHNFTSLWQAWAAQHGAVVRNQAHGSPANILDLYATVDIPEIEGVDALRIKMASSAGHVTGKKLVSSESATWLNEHFTSNLADIKIALDRFMLNGVNHMFYHGTAYSPVEEPWPGWLFYAAVHLQPSNPLWKDFSTLNAYVARSQAWLQTTTTDDDVLLYYPAYDRFSAPGRELLEHFDGVEKQFHGTPFATSAEWLQAEGYAFDYISDLQLQETEVDGKGLKTSGGHTFQTLVIPHCAFMPMETLEALSTLVAQGATVVVYKGLPVSVAGYGQHTQHQASYDSLRQLWQAQAHTFDNGVREMPVGKGRFLSGDDLSALLQQATIRRESMVDHGLQFIRKVKTQGDVKHTVYFMANTNDIAMEAWVPLQTQAAMAVLYNPMNGEWGQGRMHTTDTGVDVYVSLPAHETCLIELYPETVEGLREMRYYVPAGDTLQLTGPWTVNFVAGGPELPPVWQTDTLGWWSQRKEAAYQNFSGTAVYTTTFSAPQQKVAAWRLNLGQVKESAEIWLNGKPLGTLIGPAYQIIIPAALWQPENTLEVKVSNLMANRIAALDRQHVFWKKFYNVNFPARLPENRVNGLFSAEAWPSAPSGLAGPVTIAPLAVEPTNDEQ